MGPTGCGVVPVLIVKDGPLACGSQNSIRGKDLSLLT